MAISGRKSGYLFPQLEQIKDESPTEKYPYANMLSDMAILYIDILGKLLVNEDGTTMSFGTHSLRKTAYLLAYWMIKTNPLGLQSRIEAHHVLPVEETASMYNDARHKSTKMSQI